MKQTRILKFCGNLIVSVILLGTATPLYAQDCDLSVLVELELAQTPSVVLRNGSTLCLLSGNSVTFVSVANPAMPIEVGSASLPAGSHAVGGSISDNILAVSADNSLVLFDIHDPTNPIMLGQVAGLIRAIGVDLVGSVAYVATRTCCLMVFDVSDPSNPAPLWSHDRASWGYEDVSFQGATGYLVLSDYPRRIEVTDFSNTNAPDNFEHFYGIGPINAHAIDGTILHAASGTAYSCGYFLYPNPIEYLDTYTPPNDASISDMTHSNMRTCLALGQDGYAVLDVRNPEGVTLLATGFVEGEVAHFLELDNCYVAITSDPKLITFSDTGCDFCDADVNRDGQATTTDFTAWMHAYQRQYPIADQNRDGQVTPTDFTAWIANFNAGCP